MRNAYGAAAVTHAVRVVRAPPAPPAPRLAHAYPRALLLAWEPAPELDPPLLGAFIFLYYFKKFYYCSFRFAFLWYDPQHGACFRNSAYRLILRVSEADFSHSSSSEMINSVVTITTSEQSAPNAFIRALPL